MENYPSQAKGALKPFEDAPISFSNDGFRCNLNKNIDTNVTMTHCSFHPRSAAFIPHFQFQNQGHRVQGKQQSPSSIYNETMY